MAMVLTDGCGGPLVATIESAATARTRAASGRGRSAAGARSRRARSASRARRGSRRARSAESGPDRYLSDRVCEEIGERCRERAVAVRARVVSADRDPTDVRDSENLTQNFPEGLCRRTVDGGERDRGELARVDHIHVDVDPERAAA